MSYFKKRIAVFLCLLLAIPTLMGVLPMNSLTAEAATTGRICTRYYTIQSSYNAKNELTFSLSAEVGQEFDMGRLLYFLDTTNYQVKYFSNLSSDKYASSDTSVATVGKNTGIVKVKKKGTTVITIKYGSCRAKCTLNVYAKGKFGATSVRNKLTSKANAVLEAYNGRITSKNRYKVLNAYKAYEEEMWLVSSVVYKGFIPEWDGSGYLTQTNKIAVPEVWEVDDVYNELYSYARKINPIGTIQSKWFNISSVSAQAKSRSFTINLKDKVDASEIFAIKYYNASDDVIKEDGRAIFRIKVQDTKTGCNYYGRVYANKDSKKLTVNMDYLKLVKGRRYRLWGIDTWYNGKYGWTKGKTFTVK